MKKIVCAIMLLFVLLSTLTACGNETIKGMTCNVSINSNQFYDGKSTINLTVTCYNNDTDKIIEGFEFDLRFYDINGILLYTAPCKSDYCHIDPGSSHVQTWFDAATYPSFVVNGQVTRVMAVPKSVTVRGDDAAESTGDSDDYGESESNFGIDNIIGIAISVAAIIVGCVLFYNAYFYDGTYIGGNWMKNYPDEKFKAALSYILAIGGLIAAIVCIFI